jgi:hypothetical protein
MAFTAIKAYTTQAAESGAPAAALANFVTVPGLPRSQNVSRLVELRLDSPVTAGSPTSVVFDVYRYNRDDATVDYLTTWTVAQTDITASKVAPLIVETYGNELMTKVSFSGGTTPTFSGTVQGRALE